MELRESESEKEYTRTVQQSSHQADAFRFVPREIVRAEPQGTIASLKAKVESLEQAIARRERLIQEMAAEKAQLIRSVQVANRSVMWSLATKVHAFENKVLPIGTRRRGIYNLLWDSLKTIIFEGWSSFRLKAKQSLKGALKSRQSRVCASTGFKTRKPKRSRRVSVSEIALPPVLSNPLVSIIIPFDNHLDYTLHCLKSIQDSPSKASVEVVIVDDHSQDETAFVLPKISELRYVRNSENVGFIRSCNRGALEGRGDYLLFLNNDVQVGSGWLDKLLDPFERLDAVGLVGAKLIYPDGRLQEAGGIIWSDGSGVNFGRGDDPSKPEYNYLRETDYCSGACILIRAS
jgi:hypothetical protein